MVCYLQLHILCVRKDAAMTNERNIMVRFLPPAEGPRKRQLLQIRHCQCGSRPVQVSSD